MPFDGIVGLPLFESQVVAFDWQALTMEFLEHLPSVATDDLELRLTVESGFPFLQAALTPSGKEDPIEGKFMIDTGSFHGVMIDWPVVDEHQLLDLESGKQQEVAAGRGIGGAISPFRKAAIDRFVLDQRPLSLSHVVLRTTPGGRPPVVGRIGNIGMGVLRGYPCVFDYRGRKFILRGAGNKNADRENNAQDGGTPG